jgi:hypothetical protein
MVVARKFKAEPLKRGVFFILALLFLSANMATNKHVVHTDLAKLITVDHQVRRDLSRAERENLKTSVVSGRGEIALDPLQEVAGISPSQEIVVDSYPIPHSLTQLQPQSISLDFSPVLNL